MVAAAAAVHATQAMQAALRNRPIPMALGESEPSAWMLALTGKGWWRRADTPQAHRAMNLEWFKEMGLINPEAVYLAVRNAC